MRARQAILLLLVAALMIAATLRLTGSVVVLDLHRKVTSVQIVDGRGGRRTLAHPIIVHAGVPDADAAIEIRCMDGTVVSAGYVTPGMATWLSVPDGDGCSITR